MSVETLRERGISDEVIRGVQRRVNQLNPVMVFSKDIDALESAKDADSVETIVCRDLTDEAYRLRMNDAVKKANELTTAGRVGEAVVFFEIAEMYGQYVPDLAA